ncbi:hypothetical protein GS421_03255 [Rhodococcus hoagii]|nr:hypothetical protein [Prescottella equi]
MTLRWRRYMPGDALPWPGARISYGTLVIWFEDNSGGLSPNTVGGFLDGIGQLVRIFVSAFVEGLGGGSLPIDNSEQSITGRPGASGVPSARLSRHRSTAAVRVL